MLLGSAYGSFGSCLVWGCIFSNSFLIFLSVKDCVEVLLCVYQFADSSSAVEAFWLQLPFTYDAFTVFSLPIY